VPKDVRIDPELRQGGVEVLSTAGKGEEMGQPVVHFEVIFSVGCKGRAVTCAVMASTLMR
jgi:hypothetical protein